jgi:hypothetical protein
MSTYTYIQTDGEVYNRGRAEGQADVAVELRKILDPHDKLHLNLTGTLKRVEELLAENEWFRRQFDKHEAQWYDCHDGSEGACCKDHE